MDLVCGKTTILRKIYNESMLAKMYVSGEDIFVHEYLSSQSIEKLTRFVGDKKLLVVDEAQMIPNIGLNLKIIVDHIRKYFHFLISKAKKPIFTNL